MNAGVVIQREQPRSDHRYSQRNKSRHLPHLLLQSGPWLPTLILRTLNAAEEVIIIGDSDSESDSDANSELDPGSGSDMNAMSPSSALPTRRNFPGTERSGERGGIALSCGGQLVVER